MSLSPRSTRLALKAMAVVLVAWAGSSMVRAADVAAPAVVSAAPVAVGDPSGCATCQHGAPAGGCAACKHRVLLNRNKAPYQVNLCPGACFGYFQTQWRKWDEVCPYPYAGHGVSDTPRPPSPQVNIPRPGSELNTPRPLPGTDPKGTVPPPGTDPKDPKEPKGTGLLPLPPLPSGSKFAP